MRRIDQIGWTVLTFLMGGMAYFILELLWSGGSSPSMVLVGGLCFLAVAEMHRLLYKFPVWLQMLLGALLITAAEYVSGWILNIRLHLGVWDYSSLPGNITGQICPQYSLLWYVLSLPIMVVDDLIRWKRRGAGRPVYHWR